MGRAGPGPGAMGCLPFLYGIKICLTNALLYTKYITCISVISHSDSCACTYNKGCISNNDWVRKYPWSVGLIGLIKRGGGGGGGGGRGYSDIFKQT